MGGFRLALVMAMSLLCAVAAKRTHASEQPIVVIAAAGTVDTRLDREMLARVFLRKQLLWASGQRAQPVNLPAAHPLRLAFGQLALGAPPEAMQDYWRDMYFHGVLPPHVVASEDAVLRFVASTPGGIGYVSTCPRVPGIVIVMILGARLDCSHGE